MILAYFPHQTFARASRQSTSIDVYGVIPEVHVEELGQRHGMQHIVEEGPRLRPERPPAAARRRMWRDDLILILTLGIANEMGSQSQNMLCDTSFLDH